MKNNTDSVRLSSCRSLSAIFFIIKFDKMRYIYLYINSILLNLLILKMAETKTQYKYRVRLLAEG